MNTPFQHPSPATLAAVVERLKQGGLCALPTETVYGLAGNAYDDGAVTRIFQLKKRPRFNPLIVHYPTLEQLREDVVWDGLGASLAQAFWPGPLTMILRRQHSSRLSPLVSGGLDTVAVRLPAHPVFREVLQQLDFPLAAPSANPSGGLSPTLAQHVSKAFGDLFVVDGGPCALGLESTVVDLTLSEPRILRQGAVTQDVLKPWGIRSFRSDSGLAGEGEAPCFHSPGLLPSHYAPQKPLRIQVQNVLPHEGLLAFGPHPLPHGGVTLNLSPAGDLKEAAARLFEALHQLDEGSCTAIAVMPIPAHGLGCAINDRLQRAASQTGSPKEVCDPA